MTLVSPFLTDLDPRLAVKGSRDPLGAQAVWASVGRQLVGNLTLVSRDVAGFRTLLIGYGLPADDAAPAERLRVFLRWEQAAAACREAAGDSIPPLGALDVRRKLAKSGLFPLSEDPSHQILRDQRASGLWVLYHRAARDSGLVDDRRQLTAIGRDITMPWIDRLLAAGDILRRVRAQGVKKVHVREGGKPTDDAVVVRRLLRSGSARDRIMLARHLVYGDLRDSSRPRLLAKGRQRQLAELLRDSPDRENEPRVLLPSVRAAADERGDVDLSERLNDVLVAESALHPAQAVFDALLHDGHGADLDEFATRIGRAWPTVPSHVQADEFRRRIPDIVRPATGRTRANLWSAAADAMASNDWSSALGHLIAINGDTMQTRGGAPWAQVSNGTVNVRLSGDVALPAEQDILTGWNNPYYLPPLRSLMDDLVGDVQ